LAAIIKKGIEENLGNPHHHCVLVHKSVEMNTPITVSAKDWDVCLSCTLGHSVRLFHRRH
jgi:hypothetical protein